MARRGNRTINLPAPYLKRVWLDPSQIRDREVYPFCLPIFPNDFELNFETAITIIAACELAAEDHQWLVFPCRELFLGRAVSGQGRT